MIVRQRTPLSMLDRSFDRAFEQLTASFRDTRSALPVVDAAWTGASDDGEGGALTITVDLPGVPAEAVSVDVADHTLTVSANHATLEWTRTMRLGNQLDPESVAAHYRDGRLTISVQPLASAEPRRIAIDTSPATPAIEATSDTPSGDMSGDTSGDAGEATSEGVQAA